MTRDMDLNFSSVVSFLDRKFSKTPLCLPEVPSYSYKGRELKLEIIVYSHPRIAKIVAKIINLKNYDREPAYEFSYDLNGLSMTTFQRDIDDLISKIN